MLKRFLILLFFVSNFSFASEVATKDDIKQLSNQIMMLMKMIEMN